MPGKTIVVSESSYPDRGLVEFSFIHDGKKYRVLPKTGAGDKLEAYYKYVKYVCPKQGTSPFAYSGWKNLFDIDRVDGGDTKAKPAELPKPAPKTPKPAPKKAPPEAEQLSLKFARKLEVISAELQERGLTRMAEMLKPVALRFRKAWMGPKSIAFFDDLSNAGIEADDAITVLDALEGGAGGGAQVAEMTGIDESVCEKVFGLAKQHLLSDEVGTTQA